MRGRPVRIFNNAKIAKIDLVNLRVRDISHGGSISARAVVMQQKTHQPVQFEITEDTRVTLTDWITTAKLSLSDFIFPRRIQNSTHITTR